MRALTTLVSLCSIGLMFAATAHAQSSGVPNCECVLPSSEIGTLINPSGNVSISGTVGFTTAATGAQVPVGTVVRTAVGGAASVAFGPACLVNLSQSQKLTVSKPNVLLGDICVSLEQVVVTAQTPPVDATAVGAVVGLGAAVGGVVALSNGRNSKSQ